MIREYNEYCEDVEIITLVHYPSLINPYETVKGEGRLVIKAFNEAGYNHTLVDLIDVIEFVKINYPELLELPKEK